MVDKAIEITGHAYEADGGSHGIHIQDTTSRSTVAAAVKAFAGYCEDVKAGELVNFYIVAPDTGEIVWHTEPVADLQRAIDHVRDDQRESEPDFSAREAVDYARSILGVPQLDNSDQISFAAYRLVLQATPAELETAFDRR